MTSRAGVKSGWLILLLLPAFGCVRGGFSLPGTREDLRSAEDGTVDLRSAEDGAVDLRSAEDRSDLQPGAPAWVAVPKGTFTMGAPATEPCTLDYSDLHVVTLTHPFDIQATEVTQGEFQTLMGYNPSQATTCGSTCPVDSVSWHEAAAYCNALSAASALAGCYTCAGAGPTVLCQPAATCAGASFYDCPGYRLPTDAEWEYAYRATTTTAFYNGQNDGSACDTCTTVDSNADLIAWYCANSGWVPHPVGQKQPNGWKIFDLAGNVREWVNDLMTYNLGTASATDPWGAAVGTERVIRGASFVDDATLVRAAYRISRAPSENTKYHGFRCVRTRPLK